MGKLHKSGGINQNTLDRIIALETELQSIKEGLMQSGAEIEALRNGKATESSYGLARVSESTAVTQTNTGLVLSAKEKNPSIVGTLASKISSIITKLSPIFLVLPVSTEAITINEPLGYHDGNIAFNTPKEYATAGIIGVTTVNGNYAVTKTNFQREAYRLEQET